MNCIFCKSSRVKKTFESLSESIIYNVCNNCGCHYQNPIQKVDYDDSYWISAIDPDGNKILDFKSNNLAIVNYSAPLDGFIELEELNKNLHSIPDHPNFTPYVTSYYKGH